MIVIIDGTDCAGKTTLLERVSKKLNRGAIIKNTFKPKVSKDHDAIKVQYSQLAAAGRKLVEEAGQLIFLDRFYPSQLVYSVLREDDELHNAWYTGFEVAISDIAKYVWVYEDKETLAERYKDRGDEHVNLEQIYMLHDRYEEFFERCTLQKIKVKSMDEDAVEQVIAFIERG